LDDGSVRAIRTVIIAQTFAVRKDRTANRSGRNAAKIRRRRELSNEKRSADQKARVLHMYQEMDW
jgi:hypothetical protein